MKTEKKTSRTCCGCGGIFEKRELIRIVRTPEGEVKWDPSGRANGRGAYLCRKPECLAKAKKNKRLASSLKASLSEEIFETLSRELEQYGQ